MAAINTRLYIFGGSNYKELANNNLFCIETDWDKAKESFKRINYQVYQNLN